MTCISANNRDNTHVGINRLSDIGSYPCCPCGHKGHKSPLRAALPALKVINCLPFYAYEPIWVHMGIEGAFDQAVQALRSKFYLHNVLGVQNPWNLDCHSTLDFSRPERSIAHFKGYPCGHKKEAGYSSGGLRSSPVSCAFYVLGPAKDTEGIKTGVSASPRSFL